MTCNTQDRFVILINTCTNYTWSKLDIWLGPSLDPLEVNNTCVHVCPVGNMLHLSINAIGHRSPHGAVIPEVTSSTPSIPCHDNNASLLTVQSPRPVHISLTCFGNKLAKPLWYLMLWCVTFFTHVYITWLWHHHIHTSSFHLCTSSFCSIDISYFVG